MSGSFGWNSYKCGSLSSQISSSNLVLSYKQPVDSEMELSKVADSSPSMTPTRPGSPDSSDSPYPDISLFISKREYLLAQIRQKDAIIESLLKQVNHYLWIPC